MIKVDPCGFIMTKKKYSDRWCKASIHIVRSLLLYQIFWCGNSGIIGIWGCEDEHKTITPGLLKIV